MEQKEKSPINPILMNSGTNPTLAEYDVAIAQGRIVSIDGLIASILNPRKIKTDE